jgi:alcohol dehydrogenase, propanol-preferring
MKAMTLNRLCDLKEERRPLVLQDMPEPRLTGNEILIKVSACGVCHTELDEIEGRTPPPQLPVILGHQVVGRVVNRGKQAKRYSVDMRVGVAWIHSTCGLCDFCRAGLENLCREFKATGRDAHGGFAQYMTVPQDFAYEIPSVFSDAQAAPMLCAGAIGYRSLRLTGLQNGQNLGLTGFGASAHLVLKMVKHKFPDCRIYVFARSARERKFARQLGATWSGDTEDEAPQKLHCIIDTTPAWKPVVEGLKMLTPGGRLVINAIRKEGFDKNNLLRLDYSQHLWMEKEIKSVANVSRRDVSDFLDLAARIPLLPEVQQYPLEEANTALLELKNRKIRGAKVLMVD